jgi:hypothetical protein
MKKKVYSSKMMINKRGYSKEILKVEIDNSKGEIPD